MKQDTNKPLVLHPLLFAVFPIVAMLAQNLEWVPVSDAARPLVFSVMGAAAVFVLAWLLTRDIQRAAIITSLSLLLFFSYGHLYGILKAAGLGASIGRHRYLAPAAGMLFLGGAFWVFKYLRDPTPATRILNLVAAALLLIPFASIAGYVMGSFEPPPKGSSRLSLPAEGKPPDIYYIVADGYGRKDTLSEVYDFDNGPFLQFLGEQGFYVAAGARANYAQTSLAFASALNLDYVNALVPEQAQGRQALWSLIQDNEVRRRLEDLGYEIVAFSSGLDGTEWRDADRYLSPATLDEFAGATAFESHLAQTTGIRLAIDGAVALPRLIPALNYPYEAHRSRLRFTLDNLADLPEGDRPRFVFAHLILPHPPFVFDAEGRPLTPDAPFSLDFPSGGSEGSYIEGYRDQVIFLNKELTQILEEILRKSAVPPVIVIQADHGPDSNSGRQGYVQERMTILNAMLLPGNAAALWPHITPVNTFRVIFNQLFNGNYERLDDRALFSEYEAPYEFIDVTGAVLPP